MPPLLTMLQYLVIAAAGIVAIAAILLMVVPHWHRIRDAYAGRPVQPVDRWRKMHLEADRRRPLPKIRAATPRRGLLGRRVR